MNKTLYVIKELIQDFYKNLFSQNLSVSKNEIMQFLNLVKDQSRDCEFILSEKISSLF